MSLFVNHRFELPSLPATPSESTAEQTQEEVEDRRKMNVMRFLKFCDIFVVVFSLLVIIGLFSIPTVYYALPSQQVEVRSSLFRK